MADLSEVQGKTAAGYGLHDVQMSQLAQLPVLPSGLFFFLEIKFGSMNIIVPQRPSKPSVLKRCTSIPIQLDVS